MRTSEEDTSASAQTVDSFNSGETTPLLRSPSNENVSKLGPFCQRLDTYFHISQRGSTVGTEIMSGLTTFLTLSYIILVNPPLMAESGLSLELTTTGTCVASAITTLLVGLFANLPLGCAPGIGLTAYFTYGLVGDAFTPQSGMACCLISGILVLIFGVLGLSERLLVAIPSYIKSATIVGMGLLIAFIGLIDMGAVVRGEQGSLLKMGGLGTWPLWLSYSALLVLVWLFSRGVQSAPLIALSLTSIIFFCISQSWPTEFVAIPSFANPSDILQWPTPPVASGVGVASFFFVLLFDVSGVVFACGDKCGFIDERTNRISGYSEVIISVAVGTIIASLLGCSPMIVGVESMSGIATGGRTGLTAVVCAFGFALSTFFRPLLAFIPRTATAPVLVFVGILMMEQVASINWADKRVALPAFLTIVIMPFTYSISNGIFAGMLTVILINVPTLIGTMVRFLIPRRYRFESSNAKPVKLDEDSNTYI